MSKFTKTEGTQEIWDALDEAADNYGYKNTLAIRPEVYDEDGETFIYLNLVVLTSTGAAYFPENGVTVELGRYDNDDDETAAKARKKAIMAAKEFDIHVADFAY